MGTPIPWFASALIAIIGVEATTRVVKEVITKMVGFGTCVGTGICHRATIGEAKVTQANGHKEGFGGTTIGLFVGPPTSSLWLSSIPCSS